MVAIVNLPVGPVLHVGPLPVHWYVYVAGYAIGVLVVGVPLLVLAWRRYPKAWDDRGPRRGDEKPVDGRVAALAP